MGDSTQLRCVFQSTEEKRMTKVDWTFSSGEPAKVRKRNHQRVVECLANGVRTVWGEGEFRLQVPWALELVRSATWLGSFSSVVGRITLMKMTKRRTIFRLLLLSLLGCWDTYARSSL